MRVDDGPTRFETRRRERGRLVTLLREPCDRPVRIITGSAGMGKTTALLAYVAAAKRSQTAFIALPPGATPSDLYASLGALAVDTEEVIFDNVDAAATATVDDIVACIIQRCKKQRFIIVGRSAQRIRAYDLLARGLATKIDSNVFAFDLAETQALADDYKVIYRRDDFVQLLHDTEGWPIAVDWALRCASYERCGLHVAYPLWLQMHGHKLLRFIESQYSSESAAYSEFLRSLEAAESASPASFEDFDACGFPLVRTRSGLRPYRIFLRLLRPETTASSIIKKDTDVIRLKLFGRLRCTLGEQELVFKRRRDRHVFLYIALKTTGWATRSELLATFWPDVERAIAASALRTSLSHIRQAIAAVVGADSVDRYFCAESYVRIDFATVECDVNRFRECVKRAQDEESRDRPAGARILYEAAHRLYEAPLLTSEPPETYFHAISAALSETHAEVLRKLGNVRLRVAIDDRKRRPADEDDDTRDPETRGFLENATWPFELKPT